MFDYVHSNYDLGEEFTNVPCQTKDFEPGLGGTMSNYWISPGGHLYIITYRNTHNFEIIEKDDPEYKESMKFSNFRWVPTGSHGRVEPFHITSYIEIYPATWDGSWEDWPSTRLHFKSGKLVEFNRCKRDETF